MLKVIKPGFYTTVQDGGRGAYRHKGVPLSGTMDDMARRRVNSLLGNKGTTGIFEITMTGPKVVFGAPTYICLGGAEFMVLLNDRPIENYRVYKVEKGDRLDYVKLQRGFRGYLALKGGFEYETVLESVSQYVPLTKEATIREGMEIDYHPVPVFTPQLMDLKVEDYLNTLELKVGLGPEFELLTTLQREQLFKTMFTVSKENNRMAYQLEERLETHDLSMLTSGTLPGTVQLTPSGKLIVLMKDGQTTGGYPRVLQLTLDAISVLAQKKTADHVKFVNA